MPPTWIEQRPSSPNCAEGPLSVVRNKDRVQGLDRRRTRWQTAIANRVVADGRKLTHAKRANRKSLLPKEGFNVRTDSDRSHDRWSRVDLFHFYRIRRNRKLSIHVEVLNNTQKPVFPKKPKICEG